MHTLSYKGFSKSHFMLVITCLLVGCGQLFAQNTSIPDGTGAKGIVVDEYRRPIAGVEVTIKRSNIRTVTAEDGTFSFDSSSGNKLMLSHPDYMGKEVRLPKNLKAGKTLKIQMKEKFFKNPSVLDMPYGKSVTKDKFLGSASTVYTDQLSTTLSTNVLSALSGRLPGLNVNQTSGLNSPRIESASTSNGFTGMMVEYGRAGYSDNTQYGFNLRGGNSPVIIVDGFQSDLVNIDPETIESVSLQKDALSSLFLGMNSSRGVLYITTKKPKGDAFQVSFTGKYGMQRFIKTPEPLSAQQYSYLLNEAMVNDGKPAIYKYDDFVKFGNGTSPYTHPNVRWYDEIFKKDAPIQSYNLNVNGGGKVAQYFVSLNYMGEDGFFRKSTLDDYNTNSKYERYMITSKLNVNVTDNLKMSATIMGRIEDGNQPGATTSKILSDVYSIPNSAYPIYNPDGSYGGNSTYQQNLWNKAMGSGYIKNNTRDGWGNIVLDHDMSWLLKGLSARAVGSVAAQSRSAVYRNKQSEVYKYTPPKEEGGKGNYDMFGEIKNQVNDFKGVSNYQYMYGQVALNYLTTIGKHTIGGEVSADMKEIVDNYLLPEKPMNVNVGANYDYDNKYFAQAGITRGYYNRYAPGKRWGTFYAVGLGWDISKEAFLSQADWLNQLKLRGVFGLNGNSGSAGYYSWRQAYEQNTGSVNYPQGTGQATQWGDSEVGNSLVNPNLSWEKAHKLNLGLDIALFSSKLMISLDYYRDKYFDLLQQRGKNIEMMGLNYPNENIGKTLRTGFDLEVTYQNNIGAFNYFASANWSLNQSEILFMDEQYVPEEYMRRTGSPAGVRYGLVAEGFFQSEEEIANSPVIAGYKIRPGDLKYKDLNGDKVVNEFDLAVVGSKKPVSYFGFNLGFEYKGFECSALFQGACNRDLSLDHAGQEFILGFMAGSGGYSQAYQHALNRWTPETASTALFPRLTTENNGFGSTYNINPNYWSSSYWIRSGNFIRLKNISVAYTLPDSFSKSVLGGLKVKLFVNGQNLWTKAACDLVDPEVVSFRDYPTLKGLNAGVNIKF